MATSAYGSSEEIRVLRLDPLLTDPDDEKTYVPCIFCDRDILGDGEDVGYTQDFSLHQTKLYWYEYHPSLHQKRPGYPPKLCDHCMFPPPKDFNFVWCENEKHLYCLYCLELMLFRIQLGRFVKVCFHLHSVFCVIQCVGSSSVPL